MNPERNENPENLSLGERFKDYFLNYQPKGFNYMATFVSAGSTGIAFTHYLDGNNTNAVCSLVLGGVFGVLQFIEPYDIENDEFDLANERLAYLGAILGNRGLSNFPKELQKYFVGIFKNLSE